ncbi:MAG: hypothetical protein Q9188_003042 [Gyalolechia gomerana]
MEWKQGQGHPPEEAVRQWSSPSCGYCKRWYPITAGIGTAAAHLQDARCIASFGMLGKMSFASGQDVFCFRDRGGEGDQLLAMFLQGLKARLFWRWAEKAGSGWTGRVGGGMTKASATRNSTKF